MDEIIAIRTIESFLGFIIFMIVITIMAFMLQFIANIIIISKLPKIKKEAEAQTKLLNELQLQNREITYKIDRIEQEIKK